MKIILACITALMMVFVVSGRSPADSAKFGIITGLRESPLSSPDSLSRKTDEVPDPVFTDMSEIAELPDSCFFDDAVLLPDSCATDESVVLADSVAESPKGRLHMAVKTNMLFDALLIPNISAEFYLGSRISVYGEWMYAWWDSYPRNRFWRTYGGDVGVRCWLGRKAKARPLSGHHVGLYGGILTFDVELGGNGYMGGKPGGTLWDRFMVVTGLEYGFSLPVAKRLNIDFSIGVGYMTGKYIRYYPFDNDYYRDKEFQMNYLGPTKAEISLVWLIGKGYRSGRKGGEE